MSKAYPIIQLVLYIHTRITREIIATKKPQFTVVKKALQY